MPYVVAQYCVYVVRQRTQLCVIVRATESQLLLYCRFDVSIPSRAFITVICQDLYLQKYGCQQ